MLFDEFDALGKERGDPGDHGELRRVVNAFLQLLDRFRGPSLLIAATNHESVLDYALWRRFDDVLEVPTPTIDDLAQVLQAGLRGNLGSEIIRRAAERLNGLPHAAAEHVAADTLRAVLLDNSPRVTPKYLDEAVSRALSRPWT